MFGLDDFCNTQVQFCKIIKLNFGGNRVISQRAACLVRGFSLLKMLGGLFNHVVYLLFFDACHQRFEFVDTVCEQGLGQRMPVQFAVEELLRFFCGSRQYRFQIGHQYPEKVDTLCTDRLNFGFVSVFLDQYPWFVMINVDIGLVSQGHDFTHGLAVLAVFVFSRNGLTGLNQFVIKRLVGQARRELVVESFVDKTRAAAGDVDDFADQVRIHALHEVVQVEVDIIHAGRQFGCVIIAQVFRFQIVQIGARLDEGTA